MNKITKIIIAILVLVGLAVILVKSGAINI